ncbi:MAG: PAS domain-containing protein, partial [Methylococcales bacterium]
MTDIVIMLAKILIAVSLLLFFQKNKEGPLGNAILLLSVLMTVEVLGQLTQLVRDADAHQASILVVIVKGVTGLLAVITAVFMGLKGRGIVKGLFWDSYHEMIATANAPVFGVDLDGRITEWNSSAERLTGYLKQEVLGKKMVENFVAEDDQPSVQCVHNNTLKGDETISYELPLITQKGARVEVLLSSSSQRNRQGEIIGCIGFGQNV